MGSGIIANQIPEATIEKVRTSVNIADYIGQFVSLHKSGQNLFGICPFHDEHTPSFSVNESKQIFKCFSCGRGGNVFSFVMDYDQLNFPEAVAKVAEFGHIPLAVQISTTKRPEDPAKTQQKKLLRAVVDLTHHILLNTTSGEAALHYLHQRKLTDDTIEHFEIGYVPAERTLLKAFLTNQGYSYDEMRASGLFVEDDNGTLYDRFNDRVMFPLKDEQGDVIGFSGRVLQKDSQQAKYLNSPETVLFNKRDVLFNLDQAQRQFKQHGGAILFEGFMDVIAAYQAGVPTGIASMGTSLTEEQVGIIAHHTRQLTICYDGDAPGQHATDRAVGMLRHEQRLQLGVVVLPDGQDPDEFIKARGAEAFQQQVTQVLTPIAFRLHFLAADQDLTNDQTKLAYIDAALKEVATEPTPAGQAVYLQQVSELTGVATTALQQSMPKSAPVAAPGAATPQYAPAAAPQAQATHFDRYERAERELLGIAWQIPAVARRLHQADFTFPDDTYQQLFTGWLNFAAKHDPANVASFLDAVSPELVNTASDIAMQDKPAPNDETVEDLIATVEAGKSVRQLAQVKQDLHQAQQLGDKAGVTKLTATYIELMRTLKAAQAE